jgi:hypothetical protein
VLVGYLSKCSEMGKRVPESNMANALQKTLVETRLAASLFPRLVDSGPKGNPFQGRVIFSGFIS